MNLSPFRLFALCLLIALVSGAAGGGLVLRYVPTSPSALPVPTAATSTASLPDEDRSTIDVVKSASPAVVAINISKAISQSDASAQDPFTNDPFFAPFFQNQPKAKPTPSDPSAPVQKTRIGGGSGFLVTEDGLIVTNRHVVSDESAEYTVVLQDGRKLPAKVLARDTVLDLALIKIEGKGFPHLDLGDSDKLTVGQTVIAIGYALAEFQNSVTKGVVSGINRHLVAGGTDNGSEVIEEAIQTDAAINPGNSGGPLLDLHGRVIGMNTAVSQDGQSLGFALPVNALKRAIESVQKTGRIVRPWLGVRYLLIDEEYAKKNSLSYTYGALIVRGDNRGDLAVIPGSPADKAGIVENDIILTVNGVKLDENRSLASALGAFAPGDKLTLKVVHQGKEKDVQVTLDERKE